jgi:type II secretory pathway component PulJ
MKTACHIARFVGQASPPAGSRGFQPRSSTDCGEDARFTDRRDACPTSLRGLTILEMLVSTTLLALIVLGLTLMFVQTQKAFKTGIKQTDVTDAGRTITDMIARDLSQVVDAGNSNIINLFWQWTPQNSLEQKVQSGNTTLLVSYQLQEIYCLVHTNTTWMGIGYVVASQAPGVGSLYRYVAMTNAVPSVFTNSLFWPFANAVTTQTFTNNSNFSLIADGVVHLVIRASDQYGNESSTETAAENGQAPAVIAYPLAPNPLFPNTLTNTLPYSIQLEVGVLEPETYERAKSLSGVPTVQSNYMFEAAGQTHIFRQNILVPGVYR